MSAAPAHNPDHHHAQEAAHAAPASANNLRYNHGLLGVLNATANLVKGVTYDATKETFAHAANTNPGNAHHHPANDPHHGTAANVAHAAAAVAHAAHNDAAHGEQDLGDKMISALAHAGHYGAAFPLLATALKWGKDKLFPPIHEVAVEDQHLGEQILHKLKKDKKPNKGKIQLDHHELIGFCKGLDIANLQRAFHMFKDRDRFNKALQRPAGREEIKKQIANLLDWTGEADRKVIEQQTRLLLQFLHVDIKEHNTPASHGHPAHHSEHLHAHGIDSRVSKQHGELIGIIENMRNWLTEANVNKIYDLEEKEADFEMNYDKIGDSILKVNDKNLKPFLNRIKNDGMDNMEIKVGDLLDPTNIAAELKHNPDDLREEISNLFNVNKNVTKERLTERANQMLKKLKVIPSPPVAVDPYTAIRNEIATLIITAHRNLVAGDTLAKLYPNAEAEARIFKWTDDKYKNFGATIFGEATTQNRETILATFNVSKFERAYPLLFPTVKEALLKTSDGKRRIRAQLASLLKVEEPFEHSDLVRERNAMLGLLARMNPPWAPGTPEGNGFINLFSRLDSLIAPITATSASGPFGTERAVKLLFANVTTFASESFLQTFRDLEEPDEIAAQIRGYKSSVFRREFPYLVSKEDFEHVIKEGTPEEKNLAKAQIRAFVGQNIGIVRPATVAVTLDEFHQQLGLVTQADLDPQYSALVTDLDLIKIVLTEGDRINRLFNGEKKDATEPKMSILGKQIFALADTEVESYLEKLSDNPSDIITRFMLLKDRFLRSRDLSQDEIDTIKKGLSEILVVKPTIALSRGDIENMVNAITLKLTQGELATKINRNPKAKSGYKMITELLSNILNNIDEAVLAKIYRKAA